MAPRPTSQMESVQITMESLTISTTSKQKVLLRQTPSPVASNGKPVATATGTGYLHNLSQEQRRLLYQLWEMIFEYLSSPFEADGHSSPEGEGEGRPALSDTRKGGKKQKHHRHLADIVYQSSLASVSNSSLNLYYGEEAKSASSSPTSSRSSALLADHPLSEEIWVQAATFDLDVICLKFLRARQWQLEEAFSMLMETMKWRRRYDIRGLVLEGEEAIKPDFLLRSGKTYFWNVDREGRPVVVITGRLHDRNAQTLEQTCLFIVHLMETGRQLFKGSEAETVTVIFDMADAPLSSFDLGSIQFMVQCFQNYYPETLGKCLILNAPWIFWGFWKMVKPILDPVVAAKIEFINEQKELHKFIAPERLQTKFGGQSSYEFKWIEANEQDAKPTPMSAEEMASLNEELERTINEFIDLTHSINHSYLMLELELEGIDELLAPKFKERDRLKQRLTELYGQLDANLLPRNLFHRLGVIQPDGSVNWPCH